MTKIVRARSEFRLMRCGQLRQNLCGSGPVPASPERLSGRIVFGGYPINHHVAGPNGPSTEIRLGARAHELVSIPSGGDASR
jgi:hypothetical protein